VGLPSLLQGAHISTTIRRTRITRSIATAAAYKTVFTQRFKESGMSWGIEGGGVILTLRLATMSQVWERIYRNYLTSRPLPTLDTKTPISNQGYAKAA